MFLRGLGFSNYYIIKIFNLVGEAAIALTEDNPYWLLDEFSHMGFKKIDEAAEKLGIEKDSEYRIQSGIRFGLRSYVAEGHSFAPVNELCEKVAEYLDLSSSLVRDVLEDMALMGMVQMTMLHQRAVVYFYGYYRAECLICGKLADLADPDMMKPLACGENLDFLLCKAEAAGGIRLSEEQFAAARDVLTSGVSIITGGPGTGKTTLINTILRVLNGCGQKVAVAAPTGRAAKRIMETTGQYASTVHRLLEYYYDEGAHTMAFGKNQADPLDVDAVIVDEASMLDLLLMGALCDAMKPGTRLILVGDADQLPSVGAGSVLEDLIESGYFHTAHLTAIFRQAQESNIVVNAHRVNDGRYPVFGGDFVLIEGDKQQETLDKVTKLAGKFPLDQVQVLTPTKKGILGSQNLNIYLQQTFNPPREGVDEIQFGQRTFRVGDRIMQLKNNYRLEFKRPGAKDGKGVFNGETGTITAIDRELSRITVEYDDDKWVEYPYTQLDEIELAYAVTVHKSQGSEFPVVIMPVSWFPPALVTRNLLYTAITRSRKQVYIVGRQDYLNAMVDNYQGKQRNSGLQERLNGFYGGLQ
ncbi:MAG: AAA family ATPase [Firmicutes bacterium]|nr:AAA family ATPase [Bacillota bacterium]